MSLTKDFLGDNYEVVRRLSEGGMGIVYLVRHRHLETHRVVKVIREQYAHNPELQERFLREARTAIRLRHPKIAQIFDFSMTDDGSAFIVMEYIEGRTLQQLLRDEGPPPLDLALEIGRQVLEALDYLHGQGYVHRDISPDNLMLTKDFEDRRLVKLIDLGIAKRTGQEAGTQLTGHGMFLGKAKYSAPEAIEGKEVGAASDVYSFGAVLYELLTGLPPFDGQTFSQLLAAQLFKEPRPFSESDPQGRIPDILRR
ncbi:uncharacterized protein LOC110245112, partial [Exaiptasia diaphana]|uniref:Protein kinase domain-containing protein n=1 Tax=Exaiptasia diaphana TaxID=2652724 RepID=A0A913XM33_EXADI